MTIEASTVISGPYTGNGVTTNFSRTFSVGDGDHVVVQVDGVAVASGYTVNTPESFPADVVFDTAPASGVEIILTRTTPQVQNTDYSAQGSVSPEQIESDLDYRTRVEQEAQRDLDRSIKAALGSSGVVFVGAAVNEFLIINADGNIAGGGDYTAITASEAAAAASATAAATSAGNAATSETNAGTQATAAAASATASAGSATAAAASATAAAASAATAAAEVAAAVATLTSDVTNVDGATTIGDTASEGSDLFRFHTSAGTANLEALASVSDEFVCYIQADGVEVTIDPNGSETINGATTLVLEDGQAAKVFKDDAVWKAVIIGAGAGGGLITTYISAASGSALESSTAVYADTSSNAISRDLPASPDDGDVIEILDDGGNFATNNLTIGRNGNNIAGVAEDMVFDMAGLGARLVYNLATTDWKFFPIFTSVEFLTGDFYTRTEFTATAAQTTFTGLTYTPGLIAVYLNGTLLQEADYTASNGSTVVLTDAAALDDEVVTIAYQNRSLSSLLGIPTNITPDADSTRSIGTTDLRYSNIWADKVNDKLVGDGPVLLETIVASGDSTVEFATGIDDTYSRYAIVCDEGTVGTDGADLRGRVSTDGGSTWEAGGGTYRYAMHYVSSGGGHTIGGSAGQSELRLGAHSGVGNHSTEAFTLYLEIYKPSNTTHYTRMYTRFIHNSASNDLIMQEGTMDWIGVAAVNGFQLYFNTGTFSGTFKLFGIR